LDHEIESIHVFDCGSNDGTLDRIERIQMSDLRLHLIQTNNPFFTDLEEVDHNRRIWHHVINDINNSSNDETIIIFLDVDEYIFAYDPMIGVVRFDRFFSQQGEQSGATFFRSVFIDRYPKIDNQGPPNGFFGIHLPNHVSDHFPYAYVQDLW